MTQCRQKLVEKIPYLYYSRVFGRVFITLRSMFIMKTYSCSLEKQFVPTPCFSMHLYIHTNFLLYLYIPTSFLQYIPVKFAGKKHVLAASDKACMFLKLNSFLNQK